MKNSFEKLSDLQDVVGYKKGEINIIALLGLFGEAGEVLNEVVLLDQGKAGIHEKMKQVCVGMAEIMDDLKKHLRDKKKSSMVDVYLDTDLEQKFDKELANVIYYVSALAKNRGNDLAYYAELAVKIVNQKSKKDITNG